MNELATILERRRTARASTEDAVLATVVHVRGSAYRRPGARMLLLPDGTRLGTISGGCLETDVARKAWWWTDDGVAVRVFDNSVEDAARDFGLGCNGVITVLLERVGMTGAGRVLDFLAGTQARREGAVVATVVRADDEGPWRTGDHYLHDAQGEPCDGAGFFTAELSNAVRDTVSSRKSRLVHLAEADVFVEWVGAPQRVFLFGAGHDVVPMSTACAMQGWAVTIADLHANQLLPARFPAASDFFAIPVSGDISALGIGREDAVVVMTHNYPQDSRLLPQLLAANPRYLGMLGPRSRAEKMFGEIGARMDGDNLYAPVGLDLGGDHPEGIALSVAAEIQAVLHGHLGGHLRSRRGAIHAPPLECGREDPAASWSPDVRVQPVCSLAHA